jgi:D-alanyl-lipoteichoic acid acyltransferase DltB (MBOAT superfamily)
MSFVSLQFPLFFAVVSLVLAMIPLKRAWIWLVLASCWFYMAFIPSYILILFVVIGIDYVAALLIEGATGFRRKAFLASSLVANIGILAVFKYLNFAISGVDELFQVFGLGRIAWTFPLALPIGLSFHTFQSMAYTIEVYYGRNKAERHLGRYALYVLMYPQMVAGPIERPQNILPQLRELHRPSLEDWTAGLQLMAWGLFKKVVVADRLAAYVDQVYSGHGAADPGKSLLAAYLFTFQIYGDFSGYTDIARGAARTMGIRFMRNFDHPFKSRSPGEFWRRWHISLSSWFRDYLYIPLGGSRVGLARRCANLFVVFAVSGLWHGAAWTFIAWGCFHGVLVAAHAFSNAWTPTKVLLRRWGSTSAGRASQVFLTFHCVVAGFVLFRAGTIGAALGQFKAIAAARSGNLSVALSDPHLLFCLAAVASMELLQFLHRRRSMPARLLATPLPLRWGLWYALLAIILVFGAFGHEQFLYFQF